MCIDPSKLAGGSGLEKTNLDNLTTKGQLQLGLPSATSVPVIPGIKAIDPLKPVLMSS